MTDEKQEEDLIALALRQCETAKAEGQGEEAPLNAIAGVVIFGELKRLAEMLKRLDERLAKFEEGR